MMTFEARKQAPLSPPAANEVLVSASVGSDPEVIALWCTRDDARTLRGRTEQKGWASFADSKPPHPVSVRVTRVTAASARPILITQIDKLEVAYPHVQRLPGGGILVVGGRCRWRPERAERNAVIYDAGGRAVAMEVLGDGIAHVFATAAGDAWVGYIDEGVYGNHGWGGSGAPPPVGVCGDPLLAGPEARLECPGT